MSAIDFSDPATIAFLTDALTAAGVEGLEISRPDGQIRIVISGEGARITAPAATPRASHSPPVVVKAPLAGHFCAAHPAAAVTPQTLPRFVSDADILGFIRVGHVLLPLRAGHSGVLTRLLAEPGALVGFGDPLFEIELPS